MEKINQIPANAKNEPAHVHSEISFDQIDHAVSFHGGTSLYFKDGKRKTNEAPLKNWIEKGLVRVSWRYAVNPSYSHKFKNNGKIYVKTGLIEIEVTRTYKGNLGHLIKNSPPLNI